MKARQTKIHTKKRINIVIMFDVYQVFFLYVIRNHITHGYRFASEAHSFRCSTQMYWRCGMIRILVINGGKDQRVKPK